MATINKTEILNLAKYVYFAMKLRNDIENSIINLVLSEDLTIAPL